jgi:hypothetical protein
MIGRYLVDLTLALLHLIRSSYLTDDERRILLDRWMRLPARLGMRTQTTMQTLLTADAFLTAAKRSFSDKESTSETDQLNIVEGTSRECKKQLSICLERDDGLLALLCTICPYNASSDADVEPDTLPPAPVLNALIRVIFTAPAATDKQEYFENLWRQLTQILANGNQYQLLVLELLIKLACENSFMFSHRFSKFLDYSVTENSDLICAIYCHPSNYHVGRLLLQSKRQIYLN